MSDIKIHVFHTGKVCISPDLAFGGDVSKITASGIFQDKSTRIWMPVSAYLIEHSKGVLGALGNLRSPFSSFRWLMNYSTVNNVPELFQVTMRK